MPLRFLSEELAFESDEQCASFVLDQSNNAPVLEQNENGVRFVLANAGQIFETAKAAAFGAIDIKGQI